MSDFDYVDFKADEAGMRLMAVFTSMLKAEGQRFSSEIIQGGNYYRVMLTLNN